MSNKLDKLYILKNNINTVLPTNTIFKLYGIDRDGDYKAKIYRLPKNYQGIWSKGDYIVLVKSIFKNNCRFLNNSIKKLPDNYTKKEKKNFKNKLKNFLTNIF